MPAATNADPTGNFSRTLESDGTEDVVIVFVASSVWVMADEFWGVMFSVDGDGREDREGDARSRVERWDWVITDCWG